MCILLHKPTNAHIFGVLIPISLKEPQSHLENQVQNKKGKTKWSINWSRDRFLGQLLSITIYLCIVTLWFYIGVHFQQRLGYLLWNCIILKTICSWNVKHLYCQKPVKQWPVFYYIRVQTCTNKTTKQCLAGMQCSVLRLHSQ